jgi:hypothetical protein
MEERTVSPNELTVTFIHGTDSKCPGREKSKKTRSWLEDTAGAGNWNKVPAVVVVSDPETTKLLVYDGNVRTNFASENDLQLQIKIITNQQELDDYLKENFICWFRITDFNELLETMKAYAANPREGTYLAPQFRRIVVEKMRGERQTHQQEMAQAFGWTDD